MSKTNTKPQTHPPTLRKRHQEVHRAVSQQALKGEVRMYLNKQVCHSLLVRPILPLKLNQRNVRRRLDEDDVYRSRSKAGLEKIQAELDLLKYTSFNL